MVALTDRTRPLAHLELDLEVGPEAVLVRGDEAVRARDVLRARRATALAAECAGGADRILSITTAYAKERHQFGRPIGSFQAVKHKLATVLALVEHSRTAARLAAECPDGEHARLLERAAIAKAYCGDAFVRAASEGIQVHGGIGFTLGAPRAPVLQAGDGQRRAGVVVGGVSGASPALVVRRRSYAPSVTPASG